MAYQVEIWTSEGTPAGTLGPFGNIASARQGMLDHSNTVDLPTEDPWFGPEIDVLEGWFVGRTEYLVKEHVQ